MRRFLSLLVLSLPALGWGQTRTFPGPTLIPTAGDAATLATGDWNRDGKQDLAYIDDSVSPSLHILLGTATGGFTLGQTLALPADSCSYIGVGHACYLMQADINGDGKPDLLFLSTISDSSGAISVLLGNGDGTFGSAIVTTFVTNDFDPPYLATIPAIGDFNGDGKLDIVVPDYYGETRVFTGDGAGHFTQIFINSTSYNLAAFPGDFNKDGKLDFLLLYQPQIGYPAAVIYYGNGTGSFTAGTSFTLPSEPVYADVNGDGIPDLVGAAYPSNLWVMPGLASGGFGPSQTITSTLVYGDGVVAVADVNGDGIADLLVATATGLKILPGLGNLTFGAPILATAGNVYENQIVAADFNGDGIKDIAASTSGGVVMQLGSAKNSFIAPGFFNAPNAVQAMFGGDFNNDGIADALLVLPSGALQTYLGSKTGTMTAGPTQTLAAAPVTNGAIVADFDGDGNLDVAMGGGTLSFLYGKGDGSFTPATTTQQARAIYSGDLNHDGKLDLVTMTGPYSDISFNSYYVLNSLLNNGNRNFTQVNTNLPATFGGSLIGVADLNRDGYSDALFYDANVPGLTVWLGNGDGTFRAGSSTPVSEFTLNGPAAPIMFSDVDGDGNPDLVLFGTSTGTGSNLLIFYGNGTGVFGSPVSLALTHTFGSVAIADVNKDGKPDLVFSNGNLVAVTLNLGNRTYSAEQHFVAGGAVNQVLVADFNGDGYPDLLANYLYNSYFPSTPVDLLLNQTLQGAVSGSPATAAVSVTPQTVAYNQAFTISTTVAAALPGQSATPTGQVEFSIDNVNLGTVTLQAGAASLFVPGTITATIPSGAQTVSAVYSGDSVFAAATSNTSLNVLVPVYTTVSTLTASPATLQAGQFVLLNVAVTAPATVRFGVVTFYDGESTILGQTIVSSSGLASLQTNQLSIGSNSITAVYNGFTTPFGLYGVVQAVYKASTSVPSIVTVSALPTATTLSTSSTSFATGSVLTMTAKVTSSSVPFGGVTFFDGTTALGTITLSATGSATYSTVTLASGQHTLSAVYNAADPFAGSTSSTVAVTAKLASGTLATPQVLFTSANANPAGAGMQLTVRASAALGQPTGFITLLSDNQIVGTAALDGNGTASFTLASAGSAAHNLYASYGGDAAFLPASSPLFLSTDYIGSSDFSVNASNELSMEGVTVIGVDVVGSWSSTVELSCGAGVPTGYRCVFSPTTMAAPGTATLRLAGATSAWVKMTGVFVMALLLPLLRRRRLRVMVCAMVMLVAASGCGTAAARPSSVLTVQATSGAVVHSVQLLVQ